MSGVSIFGSSSQTGGGCGGSLHPHQAAPRWRGHILTQTPAGSDGPTGGSPGHLCSPGACHAEIPPGHEAAVVPHHGEHHRPSAVLHHPQHDPQSKMMMRFQHLHLYVSLLHKIQPDSSQICVLLLGFSWALPGPRPNHPVPGAQQGASLDTSEWRTSDSCSPSRPGLLIAASWLLPHSHRDIPPLPAFGRGVCRSQKSQVRYETPVWDVCVRGCVILISLYLQYFIKKYWDLISLVRNSEIIKLNKNIYRICLLSKSLVLLEMYHNSLSLPAKLPKGHF